MTYTNLELVRRTIGDRGQPARDTASGDGATFDFYLSAEAILAGAIVQVDQATLDEGTDYTLDTEQCHLAFDTPPAAGADNIVVLYRSVELSDGDVTEALRQVGLVADDDADVGPTAALLRASAMLADWVASKLAYQYDIQIDGQSLSRSQAATAWAARATALLERARRAGGFQPIAIIKIDGYNYNEVSGRDILSTNQNVRRRFYGQEDRLP